jgi:hypothetical protein
MSYMEQYILDWTTIIGTVTKTLSEGGFYELYGVVY